MFILTAYFICVFFCLSGGHGCTQANLLEIFDAMDDARLKSSCSKEEEFKKLMLSLCLCHGILLERRKFGSLGFNIRYAFVALRFYTDLQL